MARLSLLAALCLSTLSLVTSYNIQRPPVTTRRVALGKVFGGVVAVGAPIAATAAAEKGEETPEEKKARELKEKIEASKKSFRKADSYVSERFKTVDYSCVSETGSPCKDPKADPNAGQLEDL